MQVKNKNFNMNLLAFLQLSWCFCHSYCPQMRTVAKLEPARSVKAFKFQLQSIVLNKS